MSRIIREFVHICTRTATTKCLQSDSNTRKNNGVHACSNADETHSNCDRRRQRWQRRRWFEINGLCHRHHRFCRNLDGRNDGDGTRRFMRIHPIRFDSMLSAIRNCTHSTVYCTLYIMPYAPSARASAHLSTPTYSLCFEHYAMC